MFGYLGGIMIAVVVFDLATAAWQDGGPLFPQVEPGWWTLWIVPFFFLTPVSWIAALVPFLAVHWSTGGRAFADSGRAVLSGIIVMFLTFPICLWLARAVSFDVPHYTQQLFELLRVHWLAVTLAGAAFGLAYSGIERSLSSTRTRPH